MTAYAVAAAAGAVVGWLVWRYVTNRSDEQHRADIFAGSAMRCDAERRAMEAHPTSDYYLHRYAAAGIVAAEDWLDEVTP